jgi:hypothetical protein
MDKIELNGIKTNNNINNITNTSNISNINNNTTTTNNNNKEKMLNNNNNNETLEEEDKVTTEVNNENRQGLLKMLSNAIGVDVSAITVPVTLNEPASFLMRLCEGMQYSELLDKAALCEDSLERLLYVTIYSLTVYVAYLRTNKPFNPFLGETYEYTNEKRSNFKYISEQVSHHPPIGSCFVETDYWQFWQSQLLKTNFRGNYLQCGAIGSSNVLIKKTKEWFKWEAVKSTLHNVIIGSMWIDHYGDFEVVNKTNGEKAKIHMKQYGWFGKGWHEVDGEILDSKGITRYIIWGKWNEMLYAKKLSDPSGDLESENQFFETSNDINKSKKNKKKDEKEKKEKMKQLKKTIKESNDHSPLWVHTIKPIEKPSCKYMKEWTPHTLELVELNDFLRAILPPTDSRLRKDRYALEKGDAKTAAIEKHIIEEKQRAERKLREKNGEQWFPKYFQKGIDSDGQEYYKYIGNYWEERDRKVREYITNNTPNNK